MSTEPEFRFGPVATPWLTVMNRADVLQLFARHDWVASVDELAALGVNASAVYRARRAGTVVAVAPRVVAVASAELTFEGRARAVLLSAGFEAFISGPSAGHLLGLRQMPRRRIEITIKQRRRERLPTWVSVVRTSWLDEARDVVRTPSGLRIATPLRMLFGLAGQFNDFRFDRAAEDVWHLGLVTPSDAETYLADIRRSGRGGVTRFEHWLQNIEARERPSQSGLERDLLAIISRLGLPDPQRQFPLILPSGEMIHLDIAWPDLKLAFEPGHSWWHGGDLRQRRDAARDHGCAEIGWAVFRFDEVQVADQAATAKTIRSIFQERRRGGFRGSADTS